RRVRAAPGRLREGADKERAKQVCGLCTHAPLAEINDQDLSLVHDPADIDSASGLADDGADEWIADELPDLVLDRSDSLLAEARVVSGKLVVPEIPHRAVVAASEEPRSVVVVDQQAGKV